MLNKLSASHQSRLIRKREVSAREVLDAHISAIADRNADVNAFVSLDYEGAIRKADQLDAMVAQGDFAGPLHGLPIGIKDMAPVAGMPCTYGSLAYRDHIPDHDAVHVSNLRNAGAIILGKTNTPEFGQGRYGGQTDNKVAGLTRNPLNLEKTVSSSSGGSAAAVAAHFVALADGSDIAGSIRGPAAWCGLYGLRPSSGVVPVWPKIDPFTGTDVIGPMARTISDLSLFFDALYNPHSAPLHDVPDRLVNGSWNLDGLRIAWCMKPNGAKTSDAVIQANEPLKKTLMDAGAHVEETEPELKDVFQAQGILRSFGTLLKRGEDLDANPDLYSEELQTSISRARSLTIEELVRATRICNRAVQTTLAFFESFDLMIWPTSTQMPFAAEAKTGEISEDWSPLEITPVLQLPALAIPVGRTPDGMPCGVQLIGQKRSDLGLIRVAETLEPLIGFVK